MRTLVINGKDFDSLEGFYKSLEPSFMKGDCPWGQNLDSLDEIVSYNFNYTEKKENDVDLIIWKDFQKSRNEIKERRGNNTVIEIIEAIFSKNDTIDFIKK